MKMQSPQGPLRAIRAQAMRSLIVSAVLLVSGVLAQAQNNWSLSRVRIVGGGGTCTNGPFTLRATLGQPDAGATLTGGRFSLTAGILAGLGVVQTPGAPRLNLVRSGGSILLSWAGPATGYVLQQTTALNGAWTAVNQTPVDDCGIRMVTMDILPGNRFFRLKK